MENTQYKIFTQGLEIVDSRRRKERLISEKN
jgi:hypothetical protein